MRGPPTLLACLVLIACADPTAIDVTVLSEVPCTAHAEVAFSVAGDSSSLAAAAPAAVATRCDDMGDGTFSRGSVVILPQGSKDKQTFFQLKTRDDDQPVDACAADSKHCIVKTMQARFQPNKTIDAHVVLKLICLGKLCPSGETCDDHGDCVPVGDAVAPDSPAMVTAVPLPAVVTTLAGSPGNRGNADGTGSAATFAGPQRLALDNAGNMYVADQLNHLIRKVTSGGVVTTFAGTGPPDGAYADGIGTAASFNDPTGVALDGAGNVYVADLNNNRIRKITSAGLVSTLAGSGAPGFADGAAAAATFNGPTDVAADVAGNVYVADNYNNSIRMVTSAGVVTTLAGSVVAGSANGTGAAASFNGPGGVCVDGAGGVYVADSSNNRIRHVTSGGVVTTLAGSGAAMFADGAGVAASFSGPSALVMSGAAGLFVADRANSRVRMMTAAGLVTTLAGSSSMGFADGPALAATFTFPGGVAYDGASTVYVLDSGDHALRKIALGRALVVSWSASSASGPISYVAAATASTQPTATCGASGATTCTITGLTSGLAYSVTVTATNAQGTSRPSSPVVATPN